MRIFASNLMALSIAICGVAQAADETLPTATAGGFDVRLSNEGGVCVATFDREGASVTMRLSVPAPCDFNRDGQGAVRLLERADGIFLAIEHSVEISADPKVCDTRIQAVRIDRYGPDLAPRIERVAGCLPFEWDAKVFFSMFEP